MPVTLRPREEMSRTEPPQVGFNVCISTLTWWAFGEQTLWHNA